jgi:hypothetical protein
MSRFLVISIVILLILSGCNQRDDFISKHYSKDEIKELDKLSSFIIDEMSKDCEDKTENCLYQYFNQFDNIGANEEFGFNISQDSLKALLDNIDKTLFDDIWIFCDLQRSMARDSSLITIRQLCIKHDGRFGALLKDVTENKEELGIYGEPFKIVGDYTPSMNGTLLKYPERFDFKSKDEFLLVTIHLITLSYPEAII